MRRWKSGWSLGVVAIAAMSVLATTAPPASADTEKAKEPDLTKYTGQSLEWKACEFESPGAKAECALMTVPRDWAHPEADVDLQVQISRVAATGEKDEVQGVVMTNPGGPGGPGSSLGPAIATLQPELNKQFAILGMNPRGTGVSGAEDVPEGALTCDVPNGRLPQGPQDARDRSAKSIKEHLKFPTAVAEACQSEAVSPYITTWQTSHDMDLVRQLLGEKQLNYVGYSYGSWLGAKYASLFPKQTGRFVLDSSVDWQGRLMADFEDFPRMGQRQTDDVFLPWLTRLAPEIFGTTVDEAKEAIETGRKNAIEQGVDGDVYDSLFIGNGSQLAWLSKYLVLGSLITGEPLPEEEKMSAADRQLLNEVSQDRFGVAPSALTPEIVAEHNLGLQETAEDYSQMPMTRFAVACNDQKTKTTQWYKKLSDKQGPKYSYGGWQYGLSEVCGPWTDEPQQKLPKMPKSVQDNVLVVQGEFDPQTSYEQAMKALGKAKDANVVRVDDSPFHGQYATAGNYCVDGVVNNFLINGSVTDATTCASVPLPMEKKVYPVDGPVDKAGGKQRMAQKQMAAKSENAAVGRRLGEQISQQNQPVR